MIVCKFGGTSVADRAAQARLTQIVRARLDAAPLVVVSALAGVSDGLIRALDAALAGDDDGSASQLTALADRHRDLLKKTPAPDEARSVAAEGVEQTLRTIESIRRGVVLLGDASPWVRARFVGAGEILSSHIVRAALVGAGLSAGWVDAREFVRTTGAEPEKDPPNPAEIRRLVAEHLAPTVAAGRAIVTQGFIGSDPAGRPTLLGRGGSDYSAALLGAALGAERIEIWTDVDGVLTANPRVVRSARRVRLLSFAEASELAYFGAKVLHPSTVLPAVEAAIPVWVGNARRPEGGGTTIVADPAQPAGERWVVKAIADKRGVTVVNIASTRMLMAHGFLARIFRIFDLHRTVVDLISTSEVSVSLTVDDDSRLDAIVPELSEFALVEVEPGMAVICLVGDGMRGRAGLAAEIFRALGGTRVRMITQGASAINLSIVVPAADVEPAVQALHENFFRGSLPADVFGESALDLDDLDHARSAPEKLRSAQATPIPAEQLVDLARRHGTPLYVYDLAAVTRQVERLRSALGGERRWLFYACKANPHRDILRLMADLGVGVEAASPGEVQRALDCSHEPRSILMSASNARAGDIVAALARGCSVTLSARSEIRRVGELARGAEVLLRVNPGVGDGHHRHVVTGVAHSKFGLPIGEIEAALAEARESGLRVVGLHCHIGSGITDPAPILAAAERLIDAARRAPELRVLDLGGGFGIPYRETDREFDLEGLARALNAKLSALAAADAGPEIWFEPGRFLVGAAGVLVAEVTCRKESGGLVFAGVDTGMNHLLRPALYGAHHRIVNLSAPDAPVETVEVVGNICESTDVLASSRPLPRPEEGHLLAILDAGAYGFAMASRYNLWPAPREIVIPSNKP